MIKIKNIAKFLLFLTYNLSCGSVFSLSELRIFSRVSLNPLSRFVLNGQLNVGTCATIAAKMVIVEKKGSLLNIDDGAFIGEGSEISVEKVISIGCQTSFNSGVKLLGDADIGDYCIFGHNVYISSFSHVFKSDRPFIPISFQNVYDPFASKIVRVGNDCFIGANVFVSPGVNIGRGAVVAANSCVTKNVHPYTIVAGVPAKEIGKRIDFRPPAYINDVVEEHLPYFYHGFDELALVAKPGTTGEAWLKSECFQVALDAETEAKIEITGFSTKDFCLSHINQNKSIIAGHWTVTFEANFETGFLLTFKALRDQSSRSLDDFGEGFKVRIKTIRALQG